MATPASQLKVFPRAKTAREPELSGLEKRMLNVWQKGLPLTPRPFAEMARRLGVSEALVIRLLERLQAEGVISRVGPVFAPRRVGVSTLAAMAVPEHALESVAALVNGYPEVNHNYEREHEFNLWFVVTAPDETRLRAVLADMEERSGYPVLDLPLEAQYHIDLGFPLWC